MKQAQLLIRVDPELADLIPFFLEHRNDDLQRALDALRIGDFPCLQRIGHNLKGSAGGYGFDGLTAIGFRLEQAAVQQRTRLVGDCLEEFADYLRRLQITYE